MRKAAAFVPGHISGFFQVCEEASEPERKGSRNCGPCISAGVLTEIVTKPSKRTDAKVFINGRRAPEAQTTLAAVQQILRMAPAHGKWRRIPLRQDMKIVCATLAPLSTKELLEDAELRDRSRKFGGVALKSLLKQPTPQGFMKASYEFSKALGLLDDELRALIEAAESAGAIGASMVMLGKAVFALVKAPELERVKHAFLELVDPNAILTADFDLTGARLV